MANTTVNIDIQVQSKSLGQLEQELQDINEQLKDVPIGSQAFKDLSSQAQGLTRELNKATSAAEGFTDDKKFMAADGAIKLLGGSLATVVGSLGVLGVETEAFGEFERKAASAIAVAVGFKDISEGFNQLKKSTVLATTATEIFGKVSKKALIATGIGAFVVALGTVVAYWDEIVAAVSDTNDELETQNDLINTQITDSEYNLKLLRLNRTAASLRGESETEIVEEIRKQLLLEAEQYKQLLKNLELQLEKEKSQAREVTLWEKIKIGTAGYFGIQAQMSTVAAAMSDSNEKTAELEEKIKAAKEGQLNVDIQLAQLDREAIDRKQKTADEAAKRAEDAKAKADKDAADAKAKAEKEAEDLKQKAEELANLKDEIRTAEANTEAERRAKELEDLDIYYSQLIQKAIDNNLATTELEVSKQEALKALKDEYAAVDLQRAQDTYDKEVELEKLKLQGKQQAVEAVAELAGRESGIGRALLAFKQALALQETLLDIKRITFKGTQAVGEAGVAAATNVSESSKIGFPQNLITIAAAIGQGAALIGAVKNAVGKTRAQSPTITGPSFTGSQPTVPQIQTPQNITPVAPQTFNVAPTQRAYVLAGDVTTNQEAEAKLNTKRTII